LVASFITIIVTGVVPPSGTVALKVTAPALPHSPGANVPSIVDVPTPPSTKSGSCADTAERARNTAMTTTVEQPANIRPNVMRTSSCRWVASGRSRG
jgi:hypothetical protein